MPVLSDWSRTVCILAIPRPLRSKLLIFFLLTMTDPRTSLSQEVTNDIRKFFGDRVFKTAIPRNVRLAECPSFGKPVCLYDPHSSGALAYYAVAQEVLSKLFAPAAQPVEGMV